MQLQLDAIIVVDASTTKNIYLYKNQWYKINNLQCDIIRSIPVDVKELCMLFLYVFYFFEKTLQSFDAVNTFGKYFTWSLSGASPLSL